MLRGYRGRMITRTRPVVALALSLVALGMLSGCAPQPEPEPTPSAVFASEEEAFKAAEETFAAYNEAFNMAKAGANLEPDLEPVLVWLTGDMERATRKMLSEHQAEGLRLVGSSATNSFSLEEIDLEVGTVVAHVCEDVSAVDLVDGQGDSRVAAGRPDVQSLIVTFQIGDSPTSLRIASVTGADVTRC